MVTTREPTCYAPPPMDLDQQQVALSEVQLSDFRAVNLRNLVADQVVPGSVLDVGCGGGGMVVWLLKRGLDARGIDGSDPIIAAAQSFLKSQSCDPTRVSKTTLSDLAQAGHRVDNAVSMDVLEHVEDDQAMFNGLVQVTRPGGRLLVTVPAVPALYGPRDKAIGHYRRYTPERLRKLTEGQPVRIDELRYWNVLGVVPTFVSNRLLRRSVDESFRYGTPTLSKRVLRAGLSAWFRAVENPIKPPIGLTLVMFATRL